jgi:hypothetical protein
MSAGMMRDDAWNQQTQGERGKIQRLYEIRITKNEWRRTSYGKAEKSIVFSSVRDATRIPKSSCRLDSFKPTRIHRFSLLERILKSPRALLHEQLGKLETEPFRQLSRVHREREQLLAAVCREDCPAESRTLKDNVIFCPMTGKTYAQTDITTRSFSSETELIPRHWGDSCFPRAAAAVRI